MSWQAGSAAVLAVVLAAGFAWYERSRPTSRLLALVATLAALAALGRIAFAPLPNVKPTTDIVLLSGLALGGAPGFAIGAVAALTSNLFFGEGPWTPWQMVAWGLVGLLGAGLGRAARGRPLGRVPLALAGAVAGALFGELMNVATWVMASGRHGGRELLAYMSAGLPFDAAHVAGNVAFALAFGPALLAALRRFRARMHVTWVPLAAALALALLAAPALAAVPRAPLRYVERAQNADGGFGAAPGQSSSALYSGWAALGLEASGRDSSALRHAVAYLARNARQVRDPGAIERTILVLAAAGESPRRFAGRDLVAELLRRRRRDGSIAGQVNLTAFGVLALRAARSADAAVRRAAAWLTAQQNPDGGFNFAGRGGPSGVDDTSAPLQALVAAGRRSSAAVRRATAFLVRAQRPDGGFPLTPGDASNAQSTAWAVQGLVAGARNPATLRRDGSRTPLQYLASLTAPGGAVRYSRTSAQTPVWVTSQALLAFARRPLPLPRVARAAVAAATPAPAPTATATPAPTATPRPIAHAAAAAPSAAALRPVARGLGALVALLAAAY